MLVDERVCGPIAVADIGQPVRRDRQPGGASTASWSTELTISRSTNRWANCWRILANSSLPGSAAASAAIVARPTSANVNSPGGR